MDTDIRKTEERKKLVNAAQLALSPQADAHLAEEFESLRRKLDAVVTSEAAGTNPPEGPLHTDVLRLPLPRTPEEEERGGEEQKPLYPVRGRELLGQAKGFDGVNLAVPKIL